MHRTTIHPDSIVGDVLRRWPATAQEFLRRGMSCVGCAMAPFETLREVARVYGIDLTAFLRDLGTLAGREA